MFTRFRRIVLLLLLSVFHHGLKSQCSASLILVPPSCTSPGGYNLIIPNTLACTGPTPYTLFWGNAGGCTLPTLVTVPGPGTFAVTFTQGCLFGYNVTIFDNGNTLLGGAGNALGPSAPSSLTFNTISQVTPACNGFCNGSRTLFWNSSAAPLTVTLTSPTSTGNVSTTWSNVPVFSPITYTGLCAGTHSFTVRDNNGCTFTNLTFTVTQPATLTASTATAQPSCFGGNNGSFSVMPAGGTPTYQVVFSNNTTVTVNNSGTATATGFSAGVASATITDSRGCVSTVSATIGQPPLINISSTQTNVTCGGACTGQASVTVTGGGGGFTYTWNPPPGNAALKSGLCAGPNTVSITDANGCLRTHVVTITQPTSITITPTITNITCNSNCTGGATVTASGPPGPYSFTWIAPPTASVVSTTSAISNRCAGLYTLQASTNPTCVINFSINITQPPAFTLTALTTSVNCINLCNGSATANISGGNGAPYNFTWTASSPPPGTQTGSVASNLCAKNYTLTARDASNCLVSTSFSITQPPPFSFGVTTTSVNCNGGCTGVINASPSGGTAPYNYTLVSVTGSVASGSPVFTNLCAGTYTLRVRDNSPACAQQTTIAIIQPNPLLPSVSVTSITCANACTGILAGSATGGTPGYTLFWGTSTGTVAGGVLTNRCAGSYTFNVRDANNCVATPTVVNLTAPSPATVNINVTNATCSGTCNGILSASVAGGTPGYTLNWSTGFTGNPLTNRCAGNYTLTVTDANSCTTAATASVSAPAAIVITPTVTQTRCAGSCDGSATVSATGGTGTYTFSFNTAPVVTNTTGILSNRCAGNYIATATDANGCAQSSNFSITSPVALSAAITGTRNSCTSCTGAATVTPANGTPPYTAFAWTNSLNVTVGTNSTINTLCPGSYTARVTDSRSCTAVTTVSISRIVIVTVVNGGTGIQCFGMCTGSAVASASGGQAPYSFSWSPGAQTSATATGLCAGSYTVNVTDSNSPACSNTAAIIVTQPTDMTITPTQTNVTCSNLCNGAIALTVTGGTGAKTFSWSPGGMTTSSVSGLCAGVYSVIVRDANGCSKPTMTFNITPPFPAVTAVLNFTNPPNCNNPNTGTIVANPAGGNGTYTYSWSPGGSTSRSITNVPAGTYSVFITSAGCTYTFLQTLTNPAGPTLTQQNLQNVSCFNGTNGAASYAATGVGPFSFTWTPALTQNSTATTSSVTGLGSGTYVIASTDAGNSCVTTQTLVITQPSSVTPNAVISNIQCSGSTVCNGSIVVAPTGGVGPYTYTWAPLPNNTATITGLCAATHSLTLRDNNNCPYSYTFNVTTPSSITITSTLSNVQCNGSCNGSITANATGGTGAISFSWQPVGSFSGSTTASVLNLCPAVYTLVARDANNCPATRTIQITEPPALTSTLAVQQLSCSSACDASATLTASGGVPTYSFSWTGSGAATPTVNGLCAGNYTGTVTDANGCVSSHAFTVASPAIFSLNLVASHPLCNAACNGSIQTIPSGAQGTVAYVWSPAGTGQNPTGLCPSTYTVNATDANGCQALSVITLTNPPALLANVTTTNSSCNGQCNGAAISTPANAQGAVSYTWLPSGPNNPSVGGLCAGVYTLSIADANACSFTQTFQITEPALLSVNASIGPASCGVSNGSITAAPVGGTPGYTFAWTSPSPPPIATTGSFVTNLPAGIYTVAITDASGCSNTVTIPLSNSNGPTAPLTATNVICNGQCTGAASVGLISNGTPPYSTPVWVIPTPTVQAAALFSLCAQGYSVQLTDANNCVTFTGTTISEPPPISILPTATLPLCSGVCNGTVSLSTSGGVAPYTYTWLPSNTNSSVLVNACAGDHTVLVGYNSGSCVTQQTVSIAPQTSISIAPPLTEPNRCFGDCAGSATVNVLSTSGGSAALSWNNGQTGPVANGLCNGIYSVNISDAQGCANTFSVPITSPPQMSVSPSVTQPDCGLCNGSASVTASGGSGSTYAFNWTNGGSGANVSSLCAGLYQVQVTDSLGCLQTANVLVNSSSGITGELVNKADETCFALCDGAATVTAIGGTAPISYNWLNLGVPHTASTASNLCSDTYFVEMTDSRGCERTASVTIAAAVDLSVSAFITQPGCNQSNGSINVAVNGGTAPYSFSWSPAAANSATISNLPAGNYTVTITDQNGAGCAKTQVIALPNLNGPVFSVSQTNLACSGACTGSVVLTSTQNPAPTYSWSTGTNASSVTALCEGVVTVTVSSGGCNVARNFTITSSPGLFADSDVRQVQCSGECNGAMAVQASGGTLPFTFSWSPVQPSAANSIDSLCPGIYSVTVSDANGCFVTATGSVNQAPLIVITPTIQNSSCSSTPDASITVNVAGGAPQYSFSWQGPGSFTSSAQNLTNILAGTYTLSLLDSVSCSRDTVLTVIPGVTVVASAGRDTIVCPRSPVSVDGSASEGATSFTWTEIPQNNFVTAASGFTVPSVVMSQTFQLLVSAASGACTDADTIVVSAYAEPYIDAGPSYTIPVFSTVVIGGNPTTDGVFTHTWSPSFYLNDAGLQNPVASNTIDVTYTVSMAYGSGCLVSDTMVVALYPEIKITSAFTPNDDGKNDLWIIDYIDQFPDNTVEIYNRWGEQLFFSRGYAQPFDGTYKGRKLPVGTYYYVINLNHPSYTKPYTGPLTIFR